MSLLGHKSFLVLMPQIIFTKTPAQTHMITTVMAQANMCRPLLSKMSPMTLVAVTCREYLISGVFNYESKGSARRLAYQGGIGKDKGPPSHLEGHAAAGAGILPEGTDADDEEPHGEAPKPEAHENANNLNDCGDVGGAEQSGRHDGLGLVAELGWERLDVSQ